MKVKNLIAAAATALASLPLLAQQPAAQSAGPHPKSQKEVEALQKVKATQEAKDWDGELAAINNVFENFADTEFKPQLYSMAMAAAQQKNDFVQVTTWGERAIQADPKNIEARVTLAEAIAQHTREHDLDKADSIKKVNDYANQALTLLKAADAPPAGLPAEQWPQFKKELTAQAYDSMGLAAALDKKFPEAITSYKSAIEANPESPVATARLAKAYVDNKQYDDAITTADKVLAMNEAPPAVKQFAQQQKEAATKLKTPAPAK
jgi:tetratricopeptide (TPR) repeat protein